MPFSGPGTVIAIPTTPPAPAAIEVVLVDVVAMSRNPFTGQQLIQDWQAGWKELSVTLPPLSDSEAQPWLAFLSALKGSRNVFQFGADVCARYSATLMSGTPATALYWRLKNNDRKYTIDPDRYYRIQFEVIQAL